MIAIAAVHQPPASIVRMFDKVALFDGQPSTGSLEYYGIATKRAVHASLGSLTSPLSNLIEVFPENDYTEVSHDGQPRLLQTSEGSIGSTSRVSKQPGSGLAPLQRTVFPETRKPPRNWVGSGSP